MKFIGCCTWCGLEFSSREEKVQISNTIDLFLIHQNSCPMALKRAPEKPVVLTQSRNRNLFAVIFSAIRLPFAVALRWICIGVVWVKESANRSAITIENIVKRKRRIVPAVYQCKRCKVIFRSKPEGPWLARHQIWNSHNKVCSKSKGATQCTNGSSSKSGR